MNVMEPLYKTSPELWQALVCLVVMLAFGGLFSFIYTKMKMMDGYFKDTPITFIILPLVVCGLVLGINAIVYNYTGSSTTARYARMSVALLSALLVLKIRSNQRTPEELSYYLFLIGLSLLVGLGYLMYGLILFAVIVAVFVLIHVFHFPRISKRRLSLKIKVPEDLNYEHVFDDIFNKYCDKYELKSVKSSDLGTLFNLKYEIYLKKNIEQKEFLDEIRTRNSNLDIILTSDLFNAKEY